MTAAAKSYFWYHLRDKLKVLLFFVVLALSLTFIFATEQRAEGYYYEEETMVSVEQFEWTVGSPFLLLIIYSTILPVTEFSCFKKRRNLDCFYGLPVTRKELGLIHYVTGLICMVVPFSAGYLLNTLMMLRYPHAYSFDAVIGYYFVILLLAWCAYSLYVFVFNQANTTGDGIWFMILWNFLMWLAVAAVNEVMPIIYWRGKVVIDEIAKSSLSHYWGIQGEIMEVYEGVVEKRESASLWEFWGDLKCITWFVGWIITGFASTFLFFKSFGKRRMEKAGEVSDSWFGFKILIPLYATLSIINSEGEGLIWTVIFSFVGYLIYRRGFRLKLGDWISLAVIFLLNLAMLFTCFDNDFLYYIT